MDKLINNIEICKLYQEGHSLKDLGEKYNISPVKVRKILVSHGIEIKKQGLKNSNINKKRKIDLLKAIGFNEYTYGE